MKKLLILATLISTMAFGEITSDNTANMTIKAQVIQPLQVEVIKNIDLGKIITGTKTRAEGEYKITGEPESTYFVRIKELGENAGEGKIELTNKANSNIKLPVLLWTDIFPSLGATTLTGGENFHTVGVDADVPEGQPSGEYETSITVLVRYE